MKNYFAFNLKGLRVFLYCFGYILCMVLTYLVVSSSSMLTGDVIVDGQWVVYLLSIIGLCMLSSFGIWVLFYFIAKLSIDSLSYKNENFVTDYNFKEYLWIVIKGVVLSNITLGIYAPWFVTRLLRYFTQNTTHAYNYLDFNGKPMTLFGLLTIFVVLPYFLIMLFLPAITIAVYSGSSMVVFWGLLAFLLFIFVYGIYMALMGRWGIDLSYGSKRVELDVPVFQATWYIMGQLFLIVITLCLYTPMAELRIYRFFVSHTVVGNDKIESHGGMTLRPWRDFFFLWGQALLTVITVGIYSGWAYTKILSRFAARTYFESVERPTAPMPQRN